jgi:23S rRNA (cytosine1962-C5)-methyltransferase
VKIWRLKKGGDRRIRQGHPWVFSSELAHSQKEVLPGDIVELRDARDHFVAFGYAHPSSQICFRKLTSRSKETDLFSEEFLVRRLRSARDHRRAAGWTEFSHRWFYAEADGVPGLIVDAFLTEAKSWLVVVQSSTAGVERALPQVYRALESFVGELGSMTLIEAPSSRARLLEGLPVGERRVIRGEADGLENLELCFADGVRLICDLLDGQKTGFFLDQQWNASLLKPFLRASFKDFERPVWVLDICCYVGQWAAHSVQALTESGCHAEVTLLDVSEKALNLAERNLRARSARPELIQADALTTLASFAEIGRSFDVIICDPPAFIKKKADKDAGLRAYVKMNRDALKLLRPGGLYVASSCSGLVSGEDWRVVLAESAQKAGRVFRRLAMGGHGPDHPVRPEFPEGEYLKCLIGRVDQVF